LIHRLLVCSVIIAVSGTVSAQLMENETDPNRVPPPPPWKEPTFDAPAPYPLERNLIPVPVEPTDTLKLYLDKSSVQVKDNMTRLVYVIESRTGARNVLVEGFRCSNFNYTTIATGGASDKTLTPIERRTWQPVVFHGRNNFRLYLLRNFLCEVSRTNRRARDVINMVRYPPGDRDPEMTK